MARTKSPAIDQDTRGAALFEFACIDPANSIWMFTSTAALTGGANGDGAGWAGPGSLCVRTDIAGLYIQGGTKAAPVWKAVSSDVALPDVTFDSALTYQNGAVQGTLIATLTNPVAGETLSIIPNDGRLKWVGNQLQVGPSASSEGSQSYTFRRTLASAGNSPHDTALPVVVTPAANVPALFTAAGAGAWFDFSDPTQLFQNTARTMPVTTAGQSVLGVTDKSGYGNHATQPTGASAPVYSTADRGRVDLDGVAQHMRADTLATIVSGQDPAFTIHMVVSPKLRSGATQACVGAGNGTQANQRFHVGRNQASNFQVTKISDANVSVISDVGPAGKFYGRRHIYSLRVNGATCDAWLNGVRVATAVAFDADVATFDRFAIGAIPRSSIANFFMGAHHEFMLFAGAQADADVVSVQAELKAKHRTVVPAADLFLIIGQSNAEGRGNALSSPPPLVPDGQGYLYELNALSPLQSPVGDAQSGSAWTNFAIQWFASTGRIAVFAEAAVGGTGLIPASSNPYWALGGTLYPDAKTVMQNAIAYLAAEGVSVTNKYALWAQGETDADTINGTTITAALHQTYLTALFTQIRADFPGIKIFVSELGAHNDGTSEVNWASIRAAQAGAIAAVPGCYMAFTGAKDFGAGGMGDLVHYTQSSYNTMGTTMATNAAAL